MSERIPDSEALLRRIKRGWIVWNPDLRTAAVSYQAYLLRPQVTDGLSVERQNLTDPGRAIGTYQALTALIAGDVRGITRAPLDVTAKPHPDPGATIVGLPLPAADDGFASAEQEQLAADLAGDLRRIHRFEIPPSEVESEKARLKYERQRL